LLRPIMERVVAGELFSLLDVAPTIARVLGIDLSNTDGHSIDVVEKWGCRNVVLIIIDSLGYDLYQWLEPQLESIPSIGKRWPSPES